MMKMYTSSSTSVYVHMNALTPVFLMGTAALYRVCSTEYIDMYLHRYVSIHKTGVSAFKTEVSAEQENWSKYYIYI